jgi:hypothetical protein
LDRLLALNLAAGDLDRDEDLLLLLLRRLALIKLNNVDNNEMF